MEDACPHRKVMAMPMATAVMMILARCCRCNTWVECSVRRSSEAMIFLLHLRSSPNGLMPPGKRPATSVGGDSLKSLGSSRSGPTILP